MDEVFVITGLIYNRQQKELGHLFPKLGFFTLYWLQKEEIL